MCEYNSEYRACGPACEQTCETIADDHPEECEHGCFEGCFCPYGMVRDECTYVGQIDMVRLSDNSNLQKILILILSSLAHLSHNIALPE